MEQNFAYGVVPECGAIFMSNRNTKKECYRRKLFGLPSGQADFVKQVKAGMVLFLFEFERRELYGVFQASSDGEMNIVPNAFGSSGKKFPAQVKFALVWDCDPLSEIEFCDAIRENYYSITKFNFGLSERQVKELLWLFDSRKLKAVPKSMVARTIWYPEHKARSRTNNASFVRTDYDQQEQNGDASVGSVISTECPGESISSRRAVIDDRIYSTPTKENTYIIEESVDGWLFLGSKVVRSEHDMESAPRSVVMKSYPCPALITGGVLDDPNIVTGSKPENEQCEGGRFAPLASDNYANLLQPIAPLYSSKPMLRTHPLVEDQLERSSKLCFSAEPQTSSTPYLMPYGDAIAMPQVGTTFCEGKLDAPYNPDNPRLRYRCTSLFGLTDLETEYPSPRCGLPFSVNRPLPEKPKSMSICLNVDSSATDYRGSSSLGPSNSLPNSLASNFPFPENGSFASCQELKGISRPLGTNSGLGDCIPLAYPNFGLTNSPDTLSLGALHPEYLERNFSDNEGSRGFFASDLSFTPLSLSACGNNGRTNKRFSNSYDCNETPSFLHNHKNPVTSQDKHDQRVSLSDNTETFAANLLLPEGGETRSIHKISDSGVMHADSQKRVSVFSRLVNPKHPKGLKVYEEENYIHLGNDECYANSSVDEIMAMLQQCQPQWAEAKTKRLRMNGPRNRNLVASSPRLLKDHSAKISKERKVDAIPAGQDDDSQLGERISYRNFRRRSQVQKSKHDFDNACLNERAVTDGSGQHKRRKLNRPNFGTHETSGDVRVGSDDGLGLKVGDAANSHNHNDFVIYEASAGEEQKMCRVTGGSSEFSRDTLVGSQNSKSMIHQVAGLPNVVFPVDCANDVTDAERVSDCDGAKNVGSCDLPSGARDEDDKEVNGESFKDLPLQVCNGNGHHEEVPTRTVGKNCEVDLEQVIGEGNHVLASDCETTVGQSEVSPGKQGS